METPLERHLALSAAHAAEVAVLLVQVLHGEAVPGGRRCQIMFRHLREIRGIDYFLGVTICRLGEVKMKMELWVAQKHRSGVQDLVKNTSLKTGCLTTLDT